MEMIFLNIPDGKVLGASMGAIWGRQDPGGPRVGPMNLAIGLVFDIKVFEYLKWRNFARYRGTLRVKLFIPNDTIWSYGSESSLIRVMPNGLPSVRRQAVTETSDDLFPTGRPQ